MRLVALVYLFVTLNSSVQAQPATDAKELKQFIQLLTADSLAGRATGSLGATRAATWISSRFHQLGLQKFAGLSFVDTFSLSKHSLGEVALTIDNHRFENFKDIIVQGSHYQQNGLATTIVFGGFGSDAELNSITVSGNLVMLFVPNMRSTYALNNRLAKRGAAGLIVANPQNEAQFKSLVNTQKNHILQDRVSRWGNVQDTSSISFKFLDTMQSVNTISLANNKIKAMIGLSANRLIKLAEDHKITEVPQRKAHLIYSKQTDRILAANIVGILPGKSDSAIIISAHYDHLGSTDHSYFPGADDNASGVAALVKLAEHFTSIQELPYTLVFLATDAEEHGLLGSEHFIKRFGNKIIGNVNMDMIGRVDPIHEQRPYLYCLGTDKRPTLHKLVNQAAKEVDCSIDFSLNNTDDVMGLYARSDQFSFYQKGIPSIFFFSGLHADYHQVTDTANKLNYSILTRRIELISHFIELWLFSSKK
jgi:hypothetical protein